MAEQHPQLAAGSEQPLIGIPVEENGHTVVHYFADEAAADGALAADRPHRARRYAGAWADLDWDEMERELDRIRHESKPTPPVEFGPADLP